MMPALTLFTFILEFDGTTSVSQFSDRGPLQAFRKWQQHLNNPVRYGLKPDQAKALAKALADAWNQQVETNRLLGRKSPFLATLNEVTNVWCVSLSVEKKYALINIVATKATRLRPNLK